MRRLPAGSASDEERRAVNDQQIGALVRQVRAALAPQQLTGAGKLGISACGALTGAMSTFGILALLGVEALALAPLLPIGLFGAVMGYVVTADMDPAARKLFLNSFFVGATIGAPLVSVGVAALEKFHSPSPSP